MPELDDNVLQAARLGDRDAISVLVRVWHRPLRSFVATLMLAPQDADDVAQEVFLRALDRLDRVKGIDALGPFLRGIARNVIRERRRKYARESQAFLRFVDDRCRSTSEADKAKWLSDPDMLSALRACLSKLPEQSRDMLAMRYTNLETSDQIGQRFGMKGAAVRTAMRRARVALLNCIQMTYAPAAELISGENRR